MRLDGARGQTLPVSKDLLRENDFVRLIATSEVIGSTLGPLLNELAQESCIHSWQGHLAKVSEISEDERVLSLLAADREQRPTTVFVYIGIAKDGSMTPVGAAAVAERIRADFPFEGFPVIARAYISRKYRGLGFYPFMVRHRLDYCVQEWGRRLRGVHLGSGDSKVWRTVSNGTYFSAPFLFVGEEGLRVGDEVHKVRDFLSLTPSFRRILSEAMDREKDTESPDSLLYRAADAIQKFIVEGANVVPYGEVCARTQELLDSTGIDLRSRHQSLRELFAFFDAIPLDR